MKLLVTCALTAASALPSPKTKVEVTPSPVPQAEAPASKLVQVGDRDVIAISTRMRFTTMIVLPKEEQILDFVCGDKEFWVVNGSQNFAFIKPAREGGQTNLNLITAAGNVYSFTLVESDTAKPDLKVFVEPKGTGLLAAINGQPRFVATQAVDDFRHQAEVAQAEAKKAREDADQLIAEVRSQARKETLIAKAGFPAQMVFDYKFTDQDSFNVQAIYHDDKFTYIRANPRETPALYALADGKASIVQFQFADGLYTVPQLLDRFYLSIGKRKMHVVREEK